MRAVGALILGSLIACVAIMAGSSPAWAHREPTGTAMRKNAIVIPNLSHGQMSVIADNGSAIMRLAADQFPTDPVMRRLEGFINLQRFACLWGIVPGSLKDEDSPFNECAHAYLAATRALLIHLEGMPGDRTAVRSLVTKIEIEMLDHQASLVLCRYSDEPFNTAEIISPHWTSIPAHAPTSTVFGGFALALFGAGWFVIRRGRLPSSGLEKAEGADEPDDGHTENDLGHRRAT